MSSMWIFVLIGFIYMLANQGTKEYISKFNKDNHFYQPLIILIKTAMTLFFFIIFLSFSEEITDRSIVNFSAIGIIVSVLLTVTHNFYLKEEDKIKENNNNDTEIKNLLLSLKDEINLVWTHFSDDIGPHICDNKVNQKGFQIFVPITMDYFTIYNNNTDRIGKIKNDELRKEIIFIYTKGKSLIDSLLFNNKLLEELFENKEYVQIAQHLNNMIIDYGTVLQDKYYELENSTKEINVLFNKILD